jgi:hypothetical protein
MRKGLNFQSLNKALMNRMAVSAIDGQHGDTEIRRDEWQ